MQAVTLSVPGLREPVGSAAHVKSDSPLSPPLLADLVTGSLLFTWKNTSSRWVKGASS